MTTTALESPRVQAALYRSAVYEALSLGFSYPDADVRERLQVLLEDMRDFEIEIAPELRAHVVALLDALVATNPVEQQIEYNHLFDGSMVCSPYETEYEADPFAKARQTADISGFYSAFGLAVSSARPTLHDFIGSELEFMSLLTRKEAYADTRHWTRRLQTTEQAQTTFLRDHLGRWTRTLCTDLTGALEDDGDATAHFYRTLGALCQEFVEDELRRFRIRPLRLKQRMLGDREPASCPLAPDVNAVETGSLAFGDAEEYAADLPMDFTEE